MESVKPKIVFEHVEADDLPDVARSLQGSGRSDVMISAPGVGVDELLAWSLKEIKLARDARGTADECRCATDSILNGRRALACLIEWYLHRDYFCLCAETPLRAEHKAELLRKRGVFDEVALSALRSAIFERDKAEHQFTPVTLGEAEIFVEMMRSSIGRIRADSNPSLRPYLFGRMSYTYRQTASTLSVNFLRWAEPCFLFCHWVDEPWLGAIVPERSYPYAVTVRRTFFKEITTSVLLEILQTLELSFGQSQGSTSLEIGKCLQRVSGVAP
jgi:hypothetical protein